MLPETRQWPGDIETHFVCLRVSCSSMTRRAEPVVFTCSQFLKTINIKIKWWRPNEKNVKHALQFGKWRTWYASKRNWLENEKNKLWLVPWWAVSASIGNVVLSWRRWTWEKHCGRYAVCGCRPCRQRLVRMRECCAVAHGPGVSCHAVSHVWLKMREQNLGKLKHYYFGFNIPDRNHNIRKKRRMRTSTSH